MNWMITKAEYALRYIIVDTDSAEPVAMTSGGPDQERDALLIAAAPQMLATLRTVSLLLEHPEAGDIDPDRVAALIADTIRAATEG